MKKRGSAKLRDDLYRLLIMVANSKKVSSFKIHPGETINVILYTYNPASWGMRLPELPIGEFPLEEALSFLLGEAISGGENGTVPSE